MPKRLGLILSASVLLGVGALNGLQRYQFSEASVWLSGGVVAIAAFFILRAYVFSGCGQ
jgi:hypothetical protein